MDMTKDEFVAEGLKELAELHREDGKTAPEFLGMLHPLERGQVAKILVESGVLKIAGRKLFRKIYAWM